MRDHRPAASVADVTRYVAWLLPAAVLVAVYARCFLDWSLPPHEDAAMLMRYAEHFGSGHGIVWNVGEPPVDGATDFLFMALVAFVVRLGLAVETATRCVSLGAHALTLLVLAIVWYRQRMPAWLAAASFLFLGIGGGLFYAQAFFGTPMFALLALGAWAAVLHLRDHPEDRRMALLFAALALLTGLTRPEGVFLCAFMWTALLWWYRKEPKRVSVATAIYVAVMLVLGGAYFAWHRIYFGYPLPNPYYVKGGGIYLSSLTKSLASVVAMAWPFLLALVPALKLTETRRQVVFVAISVLAFACLWALLTNEMNYGRRFQYAVVPMMMIGWYPPLSRALSKSGWLHHVDGRPDVAGHGLVVVVAICALLALASQFELFAARLERHRDGRQELGAALASYRGDGLVMAVAEAGLLPLYSGWHAIDAWGLNDSHVSHDGLSAEYLDRFAPAVVMYHAYKSPLAPEQRPSGKDYALRWAAMIDRLDAYVANRPYRLAAAFGVQPHEACYYFVREGQPHSQELFELIAHFEYAWPETGQIATSMARRRFLR